MKLDYLENEQIEPLLSMYLEKISRLRATLAVEGLSGDEERRNFVFEKINRLKVKAEAVAREGMKRRILTIKHLEDYTKKLGSV